MTVRQNQSDQLIESNWIRKANPERPTVGLKLLTVGHGLPAEGCPPWAGQGLWRKMYGFSFHNRVPTTWALCHLCLSIGAANQVS